MKKNEKSGKNHHSKPHKNAGKKPSTPRSDRPKLPRASLYGIHAVLEAWQNPARIIDKLYLSDQTASQLESKLTPAHDRKRPAPLILDKRELENLCPPGAVHQGIAAVAQPLPEMFLQDLLIRSQVRERNVILILDQVTDPHNVGAIIRSACAFGASGIIMQSKHAPELSGVLAKTACGALEHLPVVFETNLSRAIETLKEHHFFVYGLDERGEQTTKEITPADNTALVLGAEGPGIRRLIKENCDQLVKLPTSGAIASLNVSNAAAVALYEFS